MRQAQQQDVMDDVPSMAESVLPGEDRRRRSRRVLVVEDDDELRALVTEVLDDEGYDAYSEPDTLSGFIRVLSDGADVLLVDWKMPDLDGFELLKTVRRCFPDLPVILITAYGTPEVRQRASEHGAFGFLAKPFKRAELLAQVESALSQRGRSGYG